MSKSNRKPYLEVWIKGQCRSGASIPTVNLFMLFVTSLAFTGLFGWLAIWAWNLDSTRVGVIAYYLWLVPTVILCIAGVVLITGCILGVIGRFMGPETGNEKDQTSF